MKSKKYHTHVVLNDKQHRLLILLARKDRISKTEVIRRLLEERAFKEDDKLTISLS